MYAIYGKLRVFFFTSLLWKTIFNQFIFIAHSDCYTHNTNRRHRDLTTALLRRSWKLISRRVQPGIFREKSALPAARCLPVGVPKHVHTADVGRNNRRLSEIRRNWFRGKPLAVCSHVGTIENNLFCFEGTRLLLLVNFVFIRTENRVKHTHKRYKNHRNQCRMYIDLHWINNEPEKRN